MSERGPAVGSRDAPRRTSVDAADLAGRPAPPPAQPRDAPRRAPADDAEFVELPPPPPAQLRDAADVATMSSLKKVFLLTAVNFGALTVFHFLWLPEPVNKAMSVIAAVTTVLLLAARWALARGEGDSPQRFQRRHRKLAQPLVAFGMGMALANCFFHQFFIRDMYQTSNLLLITVLAGSLFLDIRWLLGFVATAWVGWLAVILHSDELHVRVMGVLFPSHDVGTPKSFFDGVAVCRNILCITHDAVATHFTFGFLVATVMSFLVFFSRHALLVTEEQLRIRYAEMADIARKASAAKSDFLAQMSHEIRTPMNGVLGLTEELCRSPNIGGEDRELLESVRSSGEALLAIISDILDFSKIEANKMDISRHPFSLVPSVAGILKPLQVRATLQGLDFRVDVAPDVPATVIGDRQRIGQVLINLVGNALKFTRRGGIQVSVEAVTGSAPSGLVKLRFTVRDTGIGIPADKHDQVFVAFRQADGSITREHGGSGLGLTISKRLAELMGGEIGISYSVVGTGSEFFFTVLVGLADDQGANPPKRAETWNGFGSSSLETEPPSCRPDSFGLRVTGQMATRGQDGPDGYFALDGAGRTPTRTVTGGAMPTPDFDAASDRPAQRPLRVLVAEDNPTNQMLIARLLTKAGHFVHMCCDGREALDAYSTNGPFDVLISDLQMPIMGGVEAVARIRGMESDRRLRRLPIIALTAHALDRDRELCLSSGFDAWLPKPIARSELFETLYRLTMKR
ncbi:hypothetical protein DFJ74DRAFT_123499 [Hyaloraphidium curvatum]|nr:hypothetical protein DFJ74DRAFT_123499 [Hyaloraphidium curvatum]